MTQKQVPEEKTMSFKDKLIAKEGHRVHKLKAKDQSGRWAYYVVHVPPSKERSFMGALKSGSSMDLNDFGTVIASNFGEEASKATKDLLKERYGFNI